jgi:hypothetical protein
LIGKAHNQCLALEVCPIKNRRGDGALAELVHEIQGKLLGVEMLARLKKIELPGAIDFEQAKALAKSAAAAIQAGKFGYAIIVATNMRTAKQMATYQA